MTASSATTPDLVVDVNFVRTVGAGETFDYSWHVEICNDGDEAFSGYDVLVKYGYFHGHNDPYEDAYADVVDDHTFESLSLAGHACTAINPDPTHNQGGQAQCCGFATLTTAGPNSRSNNDKDTDNEHTLAMHASQTRTIVIAVVNVWGSTMSFDNEIESEVPAGWSATLDTESFNIGPDFEQGFFNLSVTSPPEISSWPVFHVWSRTAGELGDQETVVTIADDTLEEDSC